MTSFIDQADGHPVVISERTTRKKTGSTLEAISYHRNGNGVGFHVVIFRDEDGNRMMANVFPERGAVAVLQIDLLTEGDVEFGMGNSWRGDHFEPWLRREIKKYNER